MKRTAYGFRDEKYFSYDYLPYMTVVSLEMSDEPSFAYLSGNYCLLVLAPFVALSEIVPCLSYLLVVQPNFLSKTYKVCLARMTLLFIYIIFY